MQEPKFDDLKRWKFKVVYEDMGERKLKEYMTSTATTYEKAVESVTARLNFICALWVNIELQEVTSIVKPDYSPTIIENIQ